jgi:hypothetical protein
MAAAPPRRAVSGIAVDRGARGEFQSPQIRSENMWIFALLLLAGAGRLRRRHGGSRSGLSRVWWRSGVFAALRSARYIPLFAMVAAPLIASHVAARWHERAESERARSAWRVLWESSQALGAHWRITPVDADPGCACHCRGVSGWRAGGLPRANVPGVTAVNRNSGCAHLPGGRADPHLRPVGRLSHLPALPADARVFRRPQRLSTAKPSAKTTGF